MNSAQLTSLLEFAITNNFPVLVKGSPGIGKTDLIKAAAAAAGAELIISHPVVSDPTDYKGLPFVVDGKAEFLPIGDLRRLISATEPTVFFLDDLGQASASVQAACMQLLLERRINGHKVSNAVTFLAATNRRSDKAAVSGMLEPVKSRFATIVELDPDTDSWVSWAFTQNLPIELISFIRFRPDLLNNFVPSRDMVNSPSPRTVTHIGEMMLASLPKVLEAPTFTGAAGEAFAMEFCAFLHIWRNLPNPDQCILNPDSAPVPIKAAERYAILGAVSHRATPTTFGACIRYFNRFSVELRAYAIKSATDQKPELCQTEAFVKWASEGELV